MAAVSWFLRCVWFLSCCPVHITVTGHMLRVGQGSVTILSGLGFRLFLWNVKKRALGSYGAPDFILFLIPRIESLICPTMPLCLIRQFVVFSKDKLSIVLFSVLIVQFHSICFPQSHIVQPTWDLSDTGSANSAIGGNFQDIWMWTYCNATVLFTTVNTAADKF